MSSALPLEPRSSPPTSERSDTIRGFSSHIQTAITDLHRTHEMSTKQLELLWNGGTSEQSLALVKKYAALSNERMVADEFGNMIEFNDFKKLTENGTQKKTFMQAFAEKNKEYDEKIKSIVEIKTEVEAKAKGDFDLEDLI
jgi:cellobiose-specific phosphotransferase system component IIA